MNEQTMRAVQYARYGGPEQLHVAEAPRPRPSARQVVIDIAACSVNAIDILARQGRTKALDGFGFPKGSGVDFAGTVSAAGSRVTNVRVGDHVWGYIGMKPPGAHAAAAESLAIRADQVVAAPSRISLADAAALPLAGLTALQSLRSALRVTRDARVLIIGGSGGVGSTAIQVAAALGATVDAVAGSRGDVAKRAGATRVYDYRALDPRRVDGRYDAILATATPDLRPYRDILAPGGRIAALSPAALPAILSSAVTRGPRIRMVSATQNADDLAWLARAVDAGSVDPIIDARYPLERAADAHRDAEAGPAAGKRVLTMRALGS